MFKLVYQETRQNQHALDMAERDIEHEFVKTVRNAFGKTIRENIRPELEVIKKNQLRALGDIYVHPIIRPIYNQFIKKELSVEA